MVKIAEVFDLCDEEEGQNSPISQKIFKKYIEKSEEKKIREFENIEIIDEKAIIEKITIIIEFLDEFLKEEIKKPTFEELHQGKGLIILKTRVFDENFKFRIYVLIENIINEVLEIYLRNGFETHGFLLVFKLFLRFLMDL